VTRPDGLGGPPDRPVLRTAQDPPPPDREQLPLPRRTQQAHLEPQLRTRGGAGSATPFAAFAVDGPVEAAADSRGGAGAGSRDDRTGRAGRAAAFHAGARRGRDGAGARRPQG
jgi:hypothetical protein